MYRAAHGANVGTAMEVLQARISSIEDEHQTSKKAFEQEQTSVESNYEALQEQVCGSLCALSANQCPGASQPVNSVLRHGDTNEHMPFVTMHRGARIQLNGK